MKLYFDTTTWIRTVETPSDIFKRKEKEAITEILELNEKQPNEYEIISSKTQLNQLYTKKNSLRTEQVMKDSLEYVIAAIEEKTNTSCKNDPWNVNQFLDSILKNTGLPDKEDAKHITIAWINNADYFITTDWRSILNLNKTNIIENSLKNLIHPNNGNSGYEVKIIDPVCFMNEIIKN